MRALATALALCALPLAAALGGCGDEEEPPPREFFGIGPQAQVDEEDAAYMAAGGFGTIRWGLPWAGVQPEEGDDFEWAAYDSIVAVAAEHRLRVLPALGGPPEWVGEPTDLPVDGERERRGWREFLRAAVERYGPRGSFWREHGNGSAEPLPRLPIRTWQVWNEPNFFYFADPVSPPRYARLVQESHRALADADPGAELVLGGLFADPPQEPPQAMDATEFLDRLYETPGIAAEFDGIALHPYARDVERLEELVPEFRRVAERNDDSGVSLYITEIGWGSESDSEVSFEVGPEGQAEELTAAYDYLIADREELRLDSVYWFTWKDAQGLCDFCDSSGLFEEGEGFDPKPAWEAFVDVTGGSAEP